jgi:MYXO-CTERM domain-containing protein
MTNTFKTRAFLLASMIALTPAAGLAQGTATTTADTNLVNSSNADSMDTMGTTVPPSGVTVNDVALAESIPPSTQDDGNDFPWGLLGLAGLAGLLGRKRRDDDHVEVRIDRTDRAGGSTGSSGMNDRL